MERQISAMKMTEKPEEVLCISSKQGADSDSLLAIGTNDGVVRLLGMDGSGYLSEIFSVKLGSTRSIPREIILHREFLLIFGKLGTV
jgi:hypothetical protein